MLTVQAVLQVLQDIIPGWNIGKTRAERPHGGVHQQTVVNWDETTL